LVIAIKFNKVTLRFSLFSGIQRLYENATIHTTMGDIHIKLFKECPKAVENFCVHSKNGYYNGHLFHRVIKGFMIQTGDPTGDYKRLFALKLGLEAT
jgi:hypothetical protein